MLFFVPFPKVLDGIFRDITGKYGMGTLKTINPKIIVRTFASSTNGNGDLTVLFEMVFIQ